MTIDSTAVIIGLVVSILTIVGFGAAVVSFIARQGAKSALQQKAIEDNAGDTTAAHNKIRVINDEVQEMRTAHAVQQNEIENLKERMK